MGNMYLAFVLSIASGGIVFAVQPSEPVSWISNNFPPALGTMTETEEANEWAVCAATLNLYAEFATDNLEKPSNAETLEGFAHGAKIALMGAFITRLPEKMAGKSEEEIPSIFQDVASYAYMASESYPKAKEALLRSNLELREDKASWYRDLDASARDCLKAPGRKAQQVYKELMLEIFLGVGSK